MQMPAVILPFLKAADVAQEKVVIHYAVGIGRTGQVRTAWLIYGRNYSVEQAITAVTQQDRHPDESVITTPLRFKARQPVQQDLNHLFQPIADNT